MHSIHGFQIIRQIHNNRCKSIVYIEEIMNIKLASWYWLYYIFSADNVRWIVLYASITVCRISCPIARRFITLALLNVAYHHVECQDNDRRGQPSAPIFPSTLDSPIVWFVAYRPIEQIPRCTSSISHNAPFCNRNMHTFLLQNGASWDIWLMHCGICEIGLLRITCTSMKALRYKQNG